jgi:stage V sporulation protein K
MNPSEGTKQTPNPQEQRDESVPALPARPPATEVELADLLLTGKVMEFNSLRGQGPYTFKGSIFKNMDLQGVNLDFCHFQECEFQRCALTKASLRATTFWKTHIQDSNLDGLVAGNSKFHQCFISDSPIRNSDLRGSEFCASIFLGVSFSGSLMGQSVFERCEIKTGALEKINAPKMKVVMCSVKDVSFSGAHLRDGDFRQSRIEDANLQGANLVGCNFNASRWEGTFVADGAFLTRGALSATMFHPSTWRMGALLNQVNVDGTPPAEVFESLTPTEVAIKVLIHGTPGTDQILYDDALLRLSALVGLDEVKSEVRELAAFLCINRQREALGLSTHKGALHYVFAGPPGTGKTTVARILGDVLKSLGYLSKGQFVETNRADLVGRFMGETAVKTTAAVQRAVGGVLFIDEAYALTPGSEQDTYAQEAVSTLLKIMEDKRHDLVVIVAGYDNQMERFIRCNPGLVSRFANRLRFRSLEAKALTDVFVGLMKASSYVTDADTLIGVCQMCEMIREREGREFGNARTVRNVFEKMVRLQSARLVKEGGAPDIARFALLTFEDLPTKEFLNITVTRFRQMVDRQEISPYKADPGVLLDPTRESHGYDLPNQ